MAEELTTPELARLLGIRPCTLSRWAQSHGPGSVRAGWKIAGRRGGGLQAPYRWRRIDTPKSAGTLRPSRPFQEVMRVPSGWSIRLTPEERAAFHAVARARQMHLSQLFRVLVAEAAEAEGIRLPAAEVTPT
jgi:hypothetical protein